VSRVLVDTHVLLWWLADDPSLSPLARETIADPATTLLVSTGSVWEIALKRALGKLTAPDELLDAIAAAGFTSLPVAAAHAWEVRNLPFHHRDPFDRLLIAQALVERLPVVTADPGFGAYGVAIRW
jgi:PIN domain nuclease of toxin-antitoxin system